MEQRYGTDPSRGYGTGVWNGGMERVWSRSLFRTSYFDLHPYTYMIQNLFQQTRQLLDTVAQVFHPIGSGSIFFRPPRKLVDLDLRGNYFQPADIYLVFVF